MARKPRAAPPPQDEALLDQMVQDDQQAPIPAEPDKLDNLRAHVREARDLEREKEDLGIRVSEVNQKLQTLYDKTLPMLLDEARVPSITIEGEGNLPRTTAETQPVYNANIAAAWDNARQQAAFSYLTEVHHDDLIKTVVTAEFGRGEISKAREFFKNAQAAGYSVTMKQSVHCQTLTAWLKRQVEGGWTPDLEKIGGYVGRRVVLKYAGSK